MKILPIYNINNLATNKINDCNCRKPNYSRRETPLQRDIFISFGCENPTQKAQKLVSYIKSLSDFKISDKIDGNYNHIGATLTDTVLQAGLKYETVVKPKVLSILKHPEATTIKGLLKLTQGGNDKFKEIINWKNDKKPNLIIILAKFLNKQGVNTEEELKNWLKISDNQIRLRSIKGIGPKTVDYIQILVGIKTCAVDRHIYSFIEDAGISLEKNNDELKYKEAQSIIKKSAEILGIDNSIFDHSVWSYLANK
jgi:endonuclease III